MRLHVSGVGPSISTADLREKFSSAGRVLDVFRPEPRQLGDETLQREFAFVEIADEDRDRAQKLVNVLQGTVWKGYKIRITEARPDYKDRIRNESHSSDKEATSAVDADGQDCQQKEDAGPEGPAQTYRIRSPHGQVWTLPCSGTGTKKCFFMPVRQLSMEAWICQELDTEKSSLYRVNGMWKKMVEAQALRPAPDPELFNQAALPVPMVPSRARAPSHQPEAELTAAHDATKKLSESARAMEILSRFANLTSDGGPDPTDKAVSFGDDDDPNANAGPEHAHRMQVERKQSTLESMSSSDNDDDEQLGMQEGKLGTQAEALLVAFSADQRRRKHILDSADNTEGAETAEGLDMEDGDQKFSLHRLAAGVDVLGAFDGNMNTYESNENHAVDERHGGAVQAGASSADEEEAELLRALLKNEAGTLPAEVDEGGSISGEEQVSGGSEENPVPQCTAAEAYLRTENSESEEESSEQEGHGGELEGHSHDVEFRSDCTTSSSGDDAEDEYGDALQHEQASMQADDPWEAAFRLAAGRAVPNEGADELNVQKDEPEELPAVDTETVRTAGRQAAKRPSLKRARYPQQEEDVDGEDGQEEGEDLNAGAKHENAQGPTQPVQKKVSFAVASGPSDPGSGEPNENQTAEDQQTQEGENWDDMSGELNAQMKALEQELLQQHKAIKSSSKPGRSNAKREARRQKRLSAASKTEGAKDDKDPGVAKPKSRLAQIFHEQRDLEEDAQNNEQSPDESAKSRSAATDALFAQLPFRTAGRGPQVQQEDTTEHVHAHAPTTQKKEMQLETADFYIRKFADADKTDAPPLKDIAARFKRTEDLAVLEARLKVARPALLADMKSKLRMYTRRKQATQELYAKKKPKK